MVLLALFGAAGAIARAVVDARYASPDPRLLPRGILVCNVVGSLLIGLAVGMGDWLGQHLLAAGFCGALTTWSTFGLDTAMLLRRGAFRLAALNVLLSLVAGWAAALIGVAASRIIF